MILPGETEAGNARTQPCRGITWWADRDDDRGAETPLLRCPKNHIGSVDPDALKIPPRRAKYSLTESALSPFHAEPTHLHNRQREQRPERGEENRRDWCVQVGTARASECHSFPWRESG